MHIVSKLAFSLNVKQKILTIHKVIRSCDTNIVIIQHYETHLNKNQEWYVKEIWKLEMCENIRACLDPQFKLWLDWFYTNLILSAE